MANLRSKRNKWLLLLFFVILAALIAALLLWPRRSADGGAEEPPRQRDYLYLYLLYQGNWEFEVRSELVASLHPDLSDPLTLYAVREYDQPAYCYQGILYEPADDIYIAAPRVYEKILFSPAVSLPLEPGTVVTLPDGREWFTIQAVEYDVVREGTVTITLSPLLDAVPPPVALESGENRTVITPVAILTPGYPSGNGSRTPSRPPPPCGRRTARCRRMRTWSLSRRACGPNAIPCPSRLSTAPSMWWNKKGE